jgi:hypothetical protein
MSLFLSYLKEAYVDQEDEGDMWTVLVLAVVWPFVVAYVLVGVICKIPELIKSCKEDKQ